MDNFPELKKELDNFVYLASIFILIGIAGIFGENELVKSLCNIAIGAIVMKMKSNGGTNEKTVT